VTSNATESPPSYSRGTLAEEEETSSPRSRRPRPTCQAQGSLTVRRRYSNDRIARSRSSFGRRRSSTVSLFVVVDDDERRVVACRRLLVVCRVERVVARRIPFVVAAAASAAAVTAAAALRTVFRRCPRLVLRDYEYGYPPRRTRDPKRRYGIPPLILPPSRPPSGSSSLPSFLPRCSAAAEEEAVPRSTDNGAVVRSNTRGRRGKERKEKKRNKTKPCIAKTKFCRQMKRLYYIRDSRINKLKCFLKHLYYTCDSRI